MSIIYQCLAQDAGHGANSNFLNKKTNIERPEQSLSPHPLRSITSHFCLTPHPTQKGRYMLLAQKNKVENT